MLNEGNILGNRYEIIECVGSGGMADVYKALDHKLNRFVAIKVMKQEYSEDTTFVTKFIAEAQSAAGFSHPNIVSVYDVGQDKGVYYIVMELIDGITLKNYIERKGKLTVREATSIAVQISMGMEAAHSHHIVHRDIKPQNVIISREGKVKVTDFGIARAAESELKTAENVIMGSVHYTAPEMIKGSAVDYKADIYSLGITIYEMLVGEVPFDGEDTVSIAMKHIKERMPFIRVKTPEVPISLDAIVQKCTEKDADERYGSFAELITDLKQSLATPDSDFVYGTVEVEPEPSEEEKEAEEEPEAPEEENKKEQPTKFDKTMTVIGICAAVIIIGLGVVVGFMLKNTLKSREDALKDPSGAEATYNPETQRQMIEVLGMTYDEAKAALNSMNLGIHLDGMEESDEYESGQIFWQGYEKGDIVDINTTVHVKVSSGDAYQELPSVVNLTAEEAIKVLKDYDITAKETSYEYSDTVEAGCVIAQSPEAGTAITPSTEVVELTVSRGSHVRSAVVPNVKGLKLEEAKESLKKSGLEAVVVEAHSNSVAAGVVISQNYEEGTKLAENASVTITVSKGKDSGTGAAAPVTTWTLTASELPANFQSGQVAIDLKQNTDGSSKTTRIFEGTLSADDVPYVLSIQGAPGVSSGELTLYLDGNMLKSYTISF